MHACKRTPKLCLTPLLVPFPLPPSLLADEGTFVAVAFVPQYVSAGVVRALAGVLRAAHPRQLCEWG